MDGKFPEQLEPELRPGRTIALALLVAVLATPDSARAQSDGGAVPPSWQTENRQIYPEHDSVSSKVKKKPRAKLREPSPWYVPRVSVGFGLNFPELVPFETHLAFGRYIALRLFYVPRLPFNVRVEMPSDVISSAKGVGVANPDFTIRMKAVYGPQYGAEALVFPFGGSFFVGLGLSSRTMEVHGQAKSAILVCSLVEAAKEPPCPDPTARIKTDTQLELEAALETQAILMRGAVGWYWHVGSFGYVTLAGGATKPTKIERQAKVTASVDSPGADDDLNGALAEVKKTKEAELEEKALEEMRPVDEKILPLLGLTAGIRF